MNNKLKLLIFLLSATAFNFCLKPADRRMVSARRMVKYGKFISFLANAADTTESEYNFSFFDECTSTMLNNAKTERTSRSYKHRTLLWRRSKLQVKHAARRYALLKAARGECEDAKAEEDRIRISFGLQPANRK